jgi:glycosyltransferase involved in cell wall biosynthesis
MWLKGGSQLVGIAKALRRRGVDFHLTIIGEATARVQRQLDQTCLHEQIIWLRRQPREELWRTYAAHDVLLMLSSGEPFGMVTIEAMGMGCVPVAYDVPSGSREIIEHGLSGLLVRPNHEAVAAAIADLTPARLRSMSAEASRRARTHFGAERVAQNYVQLAGDLIRCKDLIRRSRLPASSAPLNMESLSRSVVVRLYHALPSSLRRRIRHALAAYPTNIRWLRERF